MPRGGYTEGMQHEHTQVNRPGWRSMIGQVMPLLLVTPVVLIGLFIVWSALSALFGTAFNRWFGG